MPKPLIRLLVTDLDNSLYDWVTFFARAFYDMASEAAMILGVPLEDLLDELQEVHQRHGDSEHPFALLETRTVVTRFHGLTRQQLIATFDKAFHRFNKTRSELLVLYPGTAACLQGLHERGVFVVGHTEASAVNARFRLTKLGVARYFTRLYAREPVTQDQEHLTHWTDANGSLDVAHLPRNEVKPNPRVLRDICRGMGTAPRQTLYVGDSLVRDVGMAKEAGVYAAWAKYGTRFDAGLWNQLVRVTHWTSEDFDRTRMANQRYAGVEPDVILHDQFSEILDHFEFDAVPSHASDAHG